MAEAGDFSRFFGGTSRGVSEKPFRVLEIAFPLTPALSLGEREVASASFLAGGRCVPPHPWGAGDPAFQNEVAFGRI